MTVELKDVIERIMKGERDFSGIEVRSNRTLMDCDVSGIFYDYMRKQDFSKEPLILSNSKLSHIDFHYMGRPYGLNFSFMVGENAWFIGSNLTKVNFKNSKLKGSSFWKADLAYADLRYCDLDDVDFWDSRIVHTDLRGVNNLERTRNMELIYPNSIKVTEKERKVIEKFLQKRRIFAVYDNSEQPDPQFL